MVTKTYQVENIQPRCDRRTTIRRLTADISGKYGAYIEAIWNSHGHGKARHIWIVIVGRGESYEVIIIDDGDGMNAYRRQRSLDMAIEERVRTGRNYQDLGLKRLAADFQHMTVYTVSAEEKAADPDGYPMWVMDYSLDDLFDMLASDAKHTIAAKPKKPDYDLLDLPSGSTGTKIHLTGAREGRPHFTAATLRKELADYLPPEVAKKVFVNGQPLEQRQIVGEPVVFTDEHPRLGKIDVNLYVPKTRSMRDELKIGADDGIREWRAFCQDISQEILGDRLNIMADGIYGRIYVKAFRDFEQASRQNFEVSLFSSPLISHFVDYMEHVVCPILEERLGVIKQNEVTEREKRLLSELSRYTSGLGEDDIIVPGPKSVLTVSPPSIEVIPGQSPQEINVDRYNPQLTIEWDTSLCGGKVQILKNGRKVRYQPGNKVGSYTLECYYRQEPKTRAKVEIFIVSQKVLRVNPPRVTVHPGRTQPFVAVNWEDNSSEAESSNESNLRWRIDPNDNEGRFLVDVRGEKQERKNGYGTQVIYRAGQKLGTFRIELFDKDNRRNIAYADITVAEPREKTGGDGGGGDGHDIVIRGAKYQVKFDRIEALPEISRLLIGSTNRRQILINLLHPACIHADKRRGDDGLLELALTQVLMQHIDAESLASGENLTHQEKTHRFAELYAEIVEAYERRQ